MKKTIYLVFIILFLFFVNSFAQQGKEKLPLITENKEVKNIILFIGDGMGLSQIAATHIKTSGAEGILNMECMPITGLLYTYSANSLITDSAAAGTALATGYRTNNGIISMSPDGKVLYTILEAARDNDFSTGIVVTSSITDATPACFVCHVMARTKQTEIASQYLKSKVNVLLGGGRQYFIPQSSSGSKRDDERDLISEAKKIGYSFVKTKEEMINVKTNYLLGLFEMGSLSTKPEPTLAEMTQKAIDILSQNKKGFFLMVEGSQIDKWAHVNNIDNVIQQTALFDESIKVGLDFAMKNKQTLVIVLADHETGGMGVVRGNLNGENMQAKFLSSSHTPIPVILFAFGPMAEKFTGVNHHTYIPKTISEILGIKNFPKIIDVQELK